MSLALPSVQPQALADALRTVMGITLSPDDAEWPVKSAEVVRELIERNDGKVDQVVELLLNASPAPTLGKLPFKTGMERLRMATPRKVANPLADPLTQHPGKIDPTVSASSKMSQEISDSDFNETLEHVKAFVMKRLPDFAPPSLLGFEHWGSINTQATTIDAAENMLFECQKHLERKASNTDASISLFHRLVDLIKGRQQDTFVCYTRYASNLAIVETKKGQSNVMVASLLAGTKLYLLIRSNQIKGSRRYAIPLDMVSKRENEIDFGALFDSDFETAGKSVKAMRQALTRPVDTLF